MSSQLFKAVAFILLAFSLITLPIIVFDEDHYPKIGQLQKQLEKLQTDNDRTRWKIKELKKEISDLRSNPGLIKRVAHQEFGYVSEDELIFIAD